MPLAQISLTLFRHFFLSYIGFGRSSGLHPVSSHSCSMYVLAGRPAFARPYATVHRSTSVMSSSLLLPQFLACLVRLTCIVFVTGCRWPYSWCFVGCCRQDLFRMGLFQSRGGSLLLYCCTTWSLIVIHGVKQDGSFVIMLHDVFNKSWK